MFCKGDEIGSGGVVFEFATCCLKTSDQIKGRSRCCICFLADRFDSVLRLLWIFKFELVTALVIIDFARDCGTELSRSV